MGLSHFRASHWQASHFIALGARDVSQVAPPGTGGMGLFAPGQIDRTAFGDDDEVLMIVIRQFLERVK
jgi:hypothetical protein